MYRYKQIFGSVEKFFMQTLGAIFRIQTAMDTILPGFSRIFPRFSRILPRFSTNQNF